MYLAPAFFAHLLGKCLQRPTVRQKVHLIVCRQCEHLTKALMVGLSLDMDCTERWTMCLCHEADLNCTFVLSYLYNRCLDAILHAQWLHMRQFTTDSYHSAVLDRL